MSVPETFKSLSPAVIRALTRMARDGGFRSHEIEDAIHDLVVTIPDLTSAREIPPGCPLMHQVRNRLQCLGRSAARRRAGVNRYAATVSAATTRHDERRRTLKVDVAMALDGLAPQEQAVCRSLADGASVAEAARRQGLTWRQANRSVAVIRSHFARIGLDGWVRG